MKLNPCTHFCAFLTLLLASCAQGPEAQTGTVVGAGLGALGGAIIGNQSGRALEGAAIGAAVGGVGGHVLGSARDQRKYQRHPRYRNQAPAAYDRQGRPLYD